MRTFSKVLFAALLAALVINTAAGVASANRSLSLNNGGTRTFSYSGRYTFGEPGGGFTIICDLLRVLTFLRDTIPKFTELIMIDNVIIRNCSGASVRVLGGRWPVRYVSFTGTLPAISNIALQIEPEGLGVRGGFLIETFFGTAACLYGRPFRAIATVNAAGEVTTKRAEEALIAPSFTELSFSSCPSFTVRGTLVPALGSPAIRLRLV